jgi:hypothetical protein
MEGDVGHCCSITKVILEVRLDDKSLETKCVTASKHFFQNLSPRVIGWIGWLSMGISSPINHQSINQSSLNLIELD